MNDHVASLRASLRLVLLLGGGLAAMLVHAQGDPASGPAAADPHAAHRHMMANTEVRHVAKSYSVPHLTLVRADGVSVSLDRELDDGRPVVLNFIFTTCTTICPLTSQVFSMLQRKLGSDIDKVHLVSISIDPEQDTPQRLSAYASRFKAGPHWQHYTGTLQASIAAQQAFEVYQGDKANHAPVTLVRGATGSNWVRFEGFATADELLEAVRGELAAARAPAAPRRPAT
jgi:protein SCO1